MRPLRFAHISDTHLVCAGSSEWMFQVQREVRDPRRNLERCLEQVAQWQPDVVLLTGDLVHEGQAEDYAARRQLLDRALPGVPLACALGNHDRRGPFRQGFLGQAPEEGPYLAWQPVEGLGILSLDTPYLHGIQGSLPPDQLDFMEQALQTPMPRGHIVLMHHPLVAQWPWAQLETPARWKDILARSSVKGVFAGHLHSSFFALVDGVPYVNAGSLAFGIDYDADSSIYTDQNTYGLGSLGPDGALGLSPVILEPARKILKRRAWARSHNG